MEVSEILINLRKIIRSLNLESKRIQKEYGVSIPQLLALTFLEQNSNYKSTHKEIANFLNLNPSTVSGIINRLEKKNLVARLPKIGDRRKTYISLTANGANLLNDSPQLLHERLTYKLKQLPDYKLKEIRETLSLLINILDIDRLSASPVITINEPLQQFNLDEIAE
jgi:DNA-binding MarR family transcriptional regulator